MKKATLVVICAIGLIGLIFIGGYIGVKYTSTVGLSQTNAENKNFEVNQSHVSGLVAEMSKAKRELATETDANARKTIISEVTDDCSNLDVSQVNSQDMKDFLNDLKNGRVK